VASASNVGEMAEMGANPIRTGHQSGFGRIFGSVGSDSATTSGCPPSFETNVWGFPWLAQVWAYADGAKSSTRPPRDSDNGHEW
jgi:hypothetical protein